LRGYFLTAKDGASLAGLEASKQLHSSFLIRVDTLAARACWYSIRVIGVISDEKQFRFLFAGYDAEVFLSRITQMTLILHCGI
jgi:hypothetical protein